MPTGYTADVADGKITDFNQYALQCARAFGARVTLRDEPLSAEIPEFKVSDYHLKSLKKKKQRLAEFMAMNQEQRQKLYEQQCEESKKLAEERIKEKNQTRERYEAMLAKAKAFKSPSPEYDNFAKFMIEQLENSIQWDCNLDYCKHETPTYKDWEEDYISDLESSINYHEESYKKELESVERRNKWVRELKKALQ